MMKLTIECCDKRYEITGNKIDAEGNDDFEFYTNDNGKMVVECTRCNNRIRLVDGLVGEEEQEKIAKEIQTLLYLPYSLHGGLKLLSLMCSEQIKAQKGEESTQMKFETVEQFAKHLGIGIDNYLKYLEDKFVDGK